MEAIQLTTGVLFLVLGAILSLLNWTTLIVTWRTGRYSSPVPFFGALFLGIGSLLLPAFRPFAWAALVLDFGTLAFLIALPTIARELWKTARFNLVEESVARSDRTTVHLCLYRRGVCVVRWKIERQPGDHGLVEMGNGGTWEREADSLIVRIGEDRAVFRRIPDGWRLASGFDHYRDNPDLSLEGLEFQE